jgi:phosphomannomutase/phosphoglucomutase
LELNDKIFKAYDIRGIAGVEMDTGIVELIGKGFGTYLLERGVKDVIVGHDNRPSWEEYHPALIRGLTSTGCDVVDLGFCLSPIVYFARQHFNIDGAAMITASHNPPKYNGFKLCHGLNAIVEDELQIVKNIMKMGKFPIGNGKVEKREIAEAYYKAVTDRVKLKKRYKVAVDCANATPGLFVPDMLEKMGCEVIPVHCNLDSSFPNHLPDPVGIEYYDDLRKAVFEHKADFGVMFDGDGDRAGFIDAKGRILYGDIILTLLVRDIVPDNPGRKVIIEAKDTELAFEETKRLGGEPIFWKTGHALLDHKVHEEDAVLCGEMSCHFWVCDDYYKYDDATYALARVLKMLDRTGKTLDELFDELPPLFNTPEYRVAVKCDDIKAFALKLRDSLRSRCDRTMEIDGIRGYLGDGWFLIRSSNTQPVISVRAEARSEEGLASLKSFLSEELKKYPEIDFSWDRQYDVV